MKQKMLLLAAVFFGVLAFILTYHQIKLEKQRILGSARDVVLVQVRENMSEGDRIKAGDIKALKCKRFRGNMTREINWTSKDRIVGRELRFPVRAGETLKWIDLKEERFRHGEGLSGVIPGGMRAISISVDATSSVTGLIRPLDHVDVIGTFRFPELKGDKAFDTITMTILQNVVVLATGTDYGKSSYSSIPSHRIKKKGYSTITLALTQKEVEMIVFATQKGRIHLSLRNFEETRVEKDLQSVNFKYLEKNIKRYNEERQKFLKNQSRIGYPR